MRFLINIFLISGFFFPSISLTDDHWNVPNLVGTWVGVNKTLSEQRGFRSWEKKVEIIEQKDRRFKGSFSYTSPR